MAINVEINNKKRLFYVDLMRIFASFSVILVHVGASGWYDTPLNSYNWQIMNLWHDIFRWPVPLFIMISGMLNIEKYDTEQPLKYGFKKILKKILHMYCALIFWTIFYNVFLSGSIKEFILNPLTFLNAKNIKTFLSYPYMAIGGNSWYHLWFLNMIIGLYILTPLVKVFVMNCKRNYLEYYLIIVFVIGMFIPLYNNVNTLKDIPLLPHKIDILLPELSGYLSYYIAGYYLSKYRLSKKAENTIYILGILSMLFTVIGTSFISIKKNELDITLFDHISPHIMLETISVFIFVKNKFENIDVSETFYNIIASLGKCSFGIYLLHVFMIAFVNRVFGLEWNTINPIMSVPIISVLVFILSYIATFGISKIPILKKYII